VQGFPALPVEFVYLYRSLCEQMYTKFVSAQAKNRGPDPVAERLRRFQVSRGLPWHKVAETLGVTRGMVMMVLRGDRRLSAKALFRLEEAERKASDQKSATERILEGLIGEPDTVARILGQPARGKGTIEVVVDYESGRSSRSLPKTIMLSAPSEAECRKLKPLFAETLDTRLIALACLPQPLRSETFLDRLTAETRARLTNAALGMVIPDWRTLVVGKGTESNETK
jgi:transcriptional regulator with XRE-family HTH domain